MVSTKDAILEHLRQNRGREIPVSEIADKYNFSYSRISNAIKDLKYRGEIDIEHRPLKKGKYTVLRLKGDSINKRFVHEREVDLPEATSTVQTKHDLKKMESFSSYLDTNTLNIFIDYLKSNEFSASSLKKMLSSFDTKSNFDLITKIIKPLQYEVGNRWERGQVSIADEHMISANIEKFLIQHIPLNNVKSDKIIVISPVEGEWHSLPLLTLELLLNEKGYRVFNLTRPLPNTSLMDFINKLNPFPTWVFISLTMKIHIGTLRQELKNLRQKFGDKLKIAIGGQGIDQEQRNSFPDATSVVTNVKELEEFLHNL
ncbi:MAG: B12-binding domain-containing protein [Candidatus Hodarchaeales archaeon]|jgi:methanogenic corrinoid protein MtbC1/predicted transcriptional regulator